MSQLIWQCRRGVLELDLLLTKFLSDVYPQLSETDKAVFVELLSQSDETLLSWFLGEGKPKSEDMQRMVASILK